MKYLPVSQFRIFESRLFKWTRIGLAAATVVILVLIGSIVYQRSASASLDRNLRSIAPQLASVEKQLEQAKQTAVVKRCSAYEAMQAFQKRLEQEALYNGCVVTTFQVSGEPSMYSGTQGQKVGTVSINQSGVRFEVKGKTLNMARVIQRISACDIPHEFDSLEIKREKALPEGSYVVATASVRVLGEDLQEKSNVKG